MLKTFCDKPPDREVIAIEFANLPDGLRGATRGQVEAELRAYVLELNASQIVMLAWWFYELRSRAAADRARESTASKS